MVEKKIYMVKGFVRKGSLKFKFAKYFIAVKPEDAVFYTYSILGSNHKVKKTQIHIEEVKELPLEEAKQVIPDKRLLEFF